MKVERSDIKHPLWRKKVDTSLFHKLDTPIPNWLSKVWKIRETFGSSTRRTEETRVSIKLNKTIYEGWVTHAKYQAKDTEYKLFFTKEFAERLKEIFLMSYMRSLEQRLRKANGTNTNDIEQEIPFWEFLDIEFNRKTKTFICKAHYYQKPIFRELFKQFIQSHLLSQIENKLDGKGEFNFIKEDWQPKSILKSTLEKQNIIYYLLDSKNALLYIGEAEHTRRIMQARKEIPEWDYFRIDCLPVWLSRTQRLELERLLIRSYATVMTNYKSIKNIPITEYRLVNKKIDD